MKIFTPGKPGKLQEKLALNMSLLTLLTVGVFSLILYTTQYHALMGAIDSRLRTAATMSRAMLPEDYHDKISGPQSVADADYQHIVDRYNRLCQELELEYLWSLMLVDNQIVFTTSTSPDKIAKNRKQAAFFEVHSNPELYRPTFERMTPTYQISDDKWGRIRVVLLPFKDQAGRPYLYGASVRLTEVDRQLSHIIYQCLLGGLLLWVGGMVASMLLARSVARPLTRLAGTIEKIAEGNSNLVAEEQGSHEQRVLASSFNRLNRVLQEKILDLAKQEESQRITLLSIGDAVLATDKERRITRLNLSAEHLTGWTSSEAVGKPLSEVFHIINAQTRQVGECPVEKVLRLGKIVGLANHTVLIARDGKEYQIADSAAPIRDPSGNTVGVVLVFRDVTEQYRMQESLLQSEERYRTLFERAGDGICLLNGESKLVAVNKAFARMHGCTTQEMQNRIVKDIVTPETMRLLDEQLRRIQSGEFLTFKVDHYHKDGHVFPIEVSASLIHSGGESLIQAFHRDITERKLAEEALQSEKEILAAIFDSSPVGMLLMDEDNMIVNANGVIMDMVSKAPDQVIGQRSGRGLGCIHSRETEKGCGFGSACPKCPLRKGILQILASGTSVHGAEIQVNLLIDGQKKPSWLRISANPIFLKGRKHFIIAVDDITELKNIEQSLQISKARLVQAQAIARVGNWELDIATKSMWGSLEAFRIYGIERITSYLSLPQVQALVVSEDRPQLDSAMQALLQTGGQYDKEFHIRRADDHALRVIHSIANLVCDLKGTPIKVVGVIQDITERKESEALMRQQAALLEVAHDAIVVQDIDGRVSFMNKAAEEILGWPFEEAKTRSISDIWVASREEAWRAARQETVSKGIWNGELTLLNRRKDEIHIDSRWTLVRADHGEPKAILMVSTDVTQARALKAQFLRAQRLESIGTLASGIAHDLNNILSPIVMGIGLLKADLGGEENRAMADMISDSAKRGSETIKQLLAFSRGSATKKGLIQPRHLLKEVDQLLQRTFPKNIQIQTTYPAYPWSIMADPSQVHQVLMNLCVNARDAMPDGGELSLKLKNQILDESVSTFHPQAKPGPHVVFEVTDSGTGIPADILDRIFEPFFTTKPLGQGTGLGLSTVFGIVKEHGGFVTVDSKVGVGTTFSVNIPAELETSEKSKGVQETFHPRGHDEIILVVDDESVIINVVRQALESQGYKVLSAKNAIEALDIFTPNQHNIKLIITDIMMPGGDGRHLVQNLRALNVKTPILAMSGLPNKTIENYLAKLAVQNIIAKPFSLETLLDKIQQLLVSKPMAETVSKNP